MATSPMRGVLRQLRRASALRDAADLTDGQLLESFLTRREEAAFEALVRRHGPMVLGVCRRVLHNAHDAEDAFQATWIVLVRKAHAIRPREMVGNWLHGVAYRTALRARSAAALRRTKERQARDMAQPEPLPDDTWRDLQIAQDDGLPDKYRVAIVLCDLEGKTRKEAARHLGWPEGTLSCRLARGRALLGQRLTRRGLTATGAALALNLAEGATAAVPTMLLADTIRVALTAANATANVAALATGVLKTMLLTKLKIGAAIVLAVGLLVAGVESLHPATTAGEPVVVQVAPATPGKAPPPPHEVPDTSRKNDDRDVWTLDFRFHDPRLVRVDVPGRGRRALWYLRYDVANRTGEPRTFIPEFELIVAGAATGRSDEVLPPVQEILDKVEAPGQLVPVKNSITIAAEPIPVAKPGAPPERVPGVAIWDEIPTDVKRFTILVRGLSNGSVVVEQNTSGPPVIRRKALQLNFKRVNGEIRFVPPAEWVYQLAKVRPAPQSDKDAARRELYLKHLALAHSLWVEGATSPAKTAAERATKEIAESIKRLRSQTQNEQDELEALREIEKAVKALQEDVHRRKGQRKELDKLQGVWRLKKIEVDRSLPAELVRRLVAERSTLGIFGDRFFLQGVGDPEQAPMIRLDPTRKPAAIDFDIGGKVFPAVYELQDGTLRICFGDSKVRPTECAAGSGRSLLTYQRKQP
ncbi:MAG TPA: sigma-70 family RNA polymerase sigma factor [Gemmataceae bacterium]|nr:sigma-70 family RNA polymerase sigma factor [Gemmataceae bacterium]